jgi:hypothetical protein
VNDGVFGDGVHARHLDRPAEEVKRDTTKIAEISARAAA